MKIPQPKEATWYAALVPRTIALFILLFQIRLLASDLADTVFFIAVLAGALFSAIFLFFYRINGRHVRPAGVFLVVFLVPALIRLFIALPRYFFEPVSETTILLDSMLLNLDRNNFSALLPFYWTALTTYFSLKSRKFFRADIILADVFFLVLFIIVPSSSMDAYRWPILMIALIALVIFLQMLSLIMSSGPELKQRRKESISAAVLVFLLVFSGGILFIRPFQERAIGRGGGLIEPKIFRFDFSQVLRLESEISINDDLVLIVKKNPEYYHTLLRRYTISGYSRKQGFHRLAYPDEAAHPQRLPNVRTSLDAIEIRNYREIDQEYYFVNFDAQAFIGINMPVEITPFETWDDSSFSSAYAVKSRTGEYFRFELTGAVQGAAEPENLGLSAEDYALYTEYGGDEQIASFAREIILGSGSSRDGAEKTDLPSYWEQIQMIYNRLKFGEYRYSLKPGIAPDGDQLKYFLFDSKKGYCTYYAFAFTLMLRSLGIPCRAAAGFFLDPSTEVFDYYPVRTDMAHAWAEVWFPGYGWIEYDPTTDFPAEGEEFRFSRGTPPELFERLMKEILDNHSRLKIKPGDEGENEKGNQASLGKKAFAFIRTILPFLAVTALVIFFLAMRSGLLWLSCLRRDSRKKSLYLWLHIKRRLALAGLTGGKAAAEADWAKSLDKNFPGLYQMYLDVAAARFSPAHFSADYFIMLEHYRLWNREYTRSVSMGRRFLAWLLPPLALICKSTRNGSGNKAACILLLLFFIFLLRGETGAQDTSPSQLDLGSRGVGQENPEGDELYESALAAQKAENWERAVELLSRGSKAYPYDFRFPWSLGNLYYNRKLYHLAWDEYRKAEKINHEDSVLLIRLANTAGYLNWNEDSALYLERVLVLEPDNIEATGNLAWMYFKLHRLGEGERLLVDALESAVYEEYLNSQPSQDLTMTLATIYSDMFQYDKAREFFIKAIRNAEASSDRYFTALAHYNLSILESRFYHYDLAYDQTNASLEAMNRSSGRLARGDLYLRRMELARTLAEFQEAYGMDSSPLSKLNLAQVFETGGRLQESLLYAKDCLKAGDNSWMLHYGIDPVRYKRDIHEVFKDTYSGLLASEYYSIEASGAGFVKNSVQRLFRIISHKFRASVHTLLYRKYSLLAADAYGRTGGVNPDALLQYYNAFEAYPRRALAYLRKARSIEEKLIPSSVPFYKFEEGKLLQNRELLLDALSESDPLWERDMIANVYTELAFTGTKTERQDAAERLFAINRGALIKNGIRLPVSLNIEDEVSWAGGIIKKSLKSAGLKSRGLTNRGLDKTREAAPRYVLSFGSSDDGYVSCELYDGVRGIIIFKKNLPLSPALSGSLKEGIFDAF